MSLRLAPLYCLDLVDISIFAKGYFTTLGPILSAVVPLKLPLVTDPFLQVELVLGHCDTENEKCVMSAVMCERLKTLAEKVQNDKLKAPKPRVFYLLNHFRIFA